MGDKEAAPTALVRDVPDAARGDLALGVSLLALAGSVDAIGFLRLGHLFVSFMSGNSTQFAVAMARGEWRGAAAAGGLVALFVIGVALGRLLALTTGRWRRAAVLACEAALLALAALVGAPLAVDAVPIVLAMGLQNAVLHRAGEVKTSLTYVTGTLVSLGENLADAVLAPSVKWVPYALMWAGIVVGAAAGAVLYERLGLRALLCPAAAAAALAVAAAMEGRPAAGATQKD